MAYKIFGWKGGSVSGSGASMVVEFPDGSTFPARVDRNVLRETLINVKNTTVSAMRLLVDTVNVVLKYGEFEVIVDRNELIDGLSEP